MTTAGVDLAVVLFDHWLQGFERAGRASPAEDEDPGEFGPGECQHRLGPSGVVAQHVALAAHQFGREGQGDGVAAAEHGGQDAVAVVEGAEAGVAAAAVPACALAFGFGQEVLARFGVEHELFELFSGHAGECGRTERDPAGSARTRRTTPPSA
ncbi:hypothetical protein JK364_48830 [Streptomyces sp. 110]|uniref:Uncharacterized protein n=1 Tax=Streptomyces endocoffeicus TaxID=2898945 RepID=A0ABS1Q660_9ACTN|nr:hypothetical protein [Streptomyces endocoffeicus]MBL1120148.1 hypothetical protein [Streptomyces endocoffeicus]